MIYFCSKIMWFLFSPRGQGDRLPLVNLRETYSIILPQLNSELYGINIYIFCRWLASSETHSVLPDVFPTVSKYFLSNNWNLDYLKILPFSQMTGCTWQQFGSGGHPEVLSFPFLYQLMILSAMKLNQKILDAMQYF